MLSLLRFQSVTSDKISCHRPVTKFQTLWCKMKRERGREHMCTDRGVCALGGEKEEAWRLLTSPR